MHFHIYAQFVDITYMLNFGNDNTPSSIRQRRHIKKHSNQNSPSIFSQSLLWLPMKRYYLLLCSEVCFHVYLFIFFYLFFFSFRYKAKCLVSAKMFLPQFKYKKHVLLASFWNKCLDSRLIAKKFSLSCGVILALPLLYLYDGDNNIAWMHKGTSVLRTFVTTVLWDLQWNVKYFLKWPLHFFYHYLCLWRNHKSIAKRERVWENGLGK